MTLKKDPLTFMHTRTYVYVCQGGGISYSAVCNHNDDTCLLPALDTARNVSSVLVIAGRRGHVWSAARTASMRSSWSEGRRGQLVLLMDGSNDVDVLNEPVATDNLLKVALV